VRRSVSRSSSLAWVPSLCLPQGSRGSRMHRSVRRLAPIPVLTIGRQGYERWFTLGLATSRGCVLVGVRDVLPQVYICVLRRESVGAARKVKSRDFQWFSLHRSERMRSLLRRVAPCSGQLAAAEGSASRGCGLFLRPHRGAPLVSENSQTAAAIVALAALPLPHSPLPSAPPSSPPLWVTPNRRPPCPSLPPPPASPALAAAGRARRDRRGWPTNRRSPCALYDWHCVSLLVRESHVT